MELSKSFEFVAQTGCPFEWLFDQVVGSHWAGYTPFYPRAYHTVWVIGG